MTLRMIRHGLLQLSRDVRVLTALTLFLAATARAEEPAPIAVAEVKHEGPVDFQREILPLLSKNCLACHNRGKAESDLVLETPQAILKGGASGPAVVAGKSGESLLLQVAARTSEPFMPPADNKIGAQSFTSEELGLIKLWIDEGAKGDAPAGAQPIAWQSLPPGVNPILAIALSDDGQYAACGRANQIFVYHLPSARLVGRLNDPALIDGTIYKQPGVAHHDLVQSLAFSPDGLTLASGGYREIKLWRRPTNVRSRELPTGAGAITASATSADGKWLATAGQDLVIRLWDLAAGTPGAVLSGHTAPVTSMSFSVDGARLYSASRDNSVRSWDLTTGMAADRIDTPHVVLSLASTGEPGQIALGGEDGLIRLCTLPAAPRKQLAALNAAPTTMALTADDKLAAIGYIDGTVQIVNAADGQVAQTLASLGAPISAVATSVDNKLVVAAAGRRVAISDLATGTAITSWEVASPAALRIALAPGQPRLAVGEFDGAVSVWDFDLAAKTVVARGRAAGKGQPITGLSYSSDATLLFTAAADGLVSAFSVSLDKPVYEVRPDGPTNALAASPDGRWLALAGTDGIVRFVRAADGVASETPPAAPAVASIDQLTFARDGRRLCAVTRDYRVRVYDVVEAPAAVAYLAESIQSATGGTSAAVLLGESVLLAADDRTLALAPLLVSGRLVGHSPGVTSLASLPAAKMLFSGGSDGSVRQWDLTKHAEVRKFDLGGAVRAVAVRGDGKRVAAAGEHKIARLWNVEDGATVAEIRGDYREQERSKRLTAEVAVYKQKVDALTAAVAAAEKDLTDKVAAAKSATEAFPATETAAVEATAKLDAATKAKTAADQAAAESTAKVETATKAKTEADTAAAAIAAIAAAATDAATKAQAALDAQTQANATFAAVAAAAKSTVEKKPDDANLATALASADKAMADVAPVLESARNLQAALAKIRDEKTALAKQSTDEQAKLTQALAEAQAAAKTAADAKAAAEKSLAEVTAATKTVTDARDAAKRLVAETSRGAEAATAALPLAKTNLELATATFQQLEQAAAATVQAVAAHEQRLNTLAFSADGKLLAIGGDDQSLRTYNADSGRFYETYSAQAGPVTTVAFAADNSLVSATADGVLRSWDQYPNWNLERVVGPVAPADAAAPAGESLLSDRVLALAFSPDGKWLASGGGEPSRSGEIRLWNTADGSPGLALVEPHSDTVFGLAFSSDSRYLASAAADKFVKVFNVADGKQLRSYEGHTHHALSTSWKFDGRFLASGGADGVIKIWNFDTGEQERTITGFKKEVTSIEFLGTGPMLLSGSADKSVRLQNADDGKGVRNFGGETDFVYSAQVTPDGATVVAGGQDSVLRVWNGADGKVLFDLPPPAAQ